MKKNFKLLITTFLVSVAMFGIANFAVAADVEKIAVVDVQKVTENSKQLKDLNTVQKKKIKELEKWVKGAQDDINNQSSDKDKEFIVKKYRELLSKKREGLNADYIKKLSVIEKDISATIAQYAKSKGYTIVVPKSVVLYGGDDITAEISKIVK